MPNYHACFWSSDRAGIVRCDLTSEDSTGLLERFATAGRVALRLSRRGTAVAAEPPSILPTPMELVWLATLTGPAWLYVAGTYLLG